MKKRDKLASVNISHSTTVMLMFFTDGCATREKAVFEII